MREIKFRAWDEINQKMVYDLLLQVAGKIRLNDYLLASENLLQFTGLKDKNGKEIYDGDIVGEEGVYRFLERGWEHSKGKWKIIGEKSKNFTGKKEERYIAGYHLLVVKWENTSCGFEPFSDSKENCFHCGGGKNQKNFEVIGNIYKNPELLT